MRELIWVVIGALFLYVLYQLYRVSRIDGGGGRGESDPPVTVMKLDEERKPVDSFQLELEVKQLRRDVAQLRLEQDEQCRLIQAVGDRLNAVKGQLDNALIRPGTAPEYSEALVFARRGLDVDAIAERCGISVSEAELVRALARRGDKPDEENRS